MRKVRYNLLEDGSSVKDAINSVVERGPRDDPVHILDLDDVVAKHRVWREMLPRVETFYAVKCNDHPAVLRTLFALGTGFDCASRREIEKIIDLGADPSRIIFAHTTKSISSITFAKQCGIELLTFDGEIELDKIKQFHPGASLVLRIRYDSDKALISLGKKFGCHPKQEGPQLLEYAKELGLNVIGISFHVGTGSSDHECFYGAIESARELFEFAKTIGFNFSLLDIGGGFPGDHDKPINLYAETINSSLQRFFPVGSNVRIIAEPGRYYVASAVTLIANVHSKRIVRNPQGAVSEMMYYLNDGMYGSFDGWNPRTHPPLVISASRDIARSPERFPTVLWGPTCDSVDLISSGLLMEELQIGDFLVFDDMGAYGMAVATNFNGFAKPRVLVYISRRTWEQLK
ncbi:ornithine decarboxylase 1-like [Toxorhynchites rutilus septentrionalis]|uniref:ornithine decarboxylase 1-like n=1 Tax=Toxorhynchites rutilus septentrionalis TaxID=329112 RepID=UPI002479CEFC|nr:ornithine decarboxylase 1-like [Toxorhynchites rutilus septentrionalis]